MSVLNNKQTEGRPFCESDTNRIWVRRQDNFTFILPTDKNKNEAAAQHQPGQSLGYNLI